MLFTTETINIFENNMSDAPAMMKTDIQEKEGSYLLEIELPGFAKEDVQAELVNGTLTIIAKRPDHIEMDESKIHYIRKERMLVGCKRSFYVGSRVKQEDITAAFKDGILNIIIANPEKSVDREERKLIPIK
ncbi:MAG: Hsp20/alpha crystallin family protein [Lachnospiraceae bacterium]|nr:Hsp20/alpha crystallin family protein [Lachnospiraceae bacterium]